MHVFVDVLVSVISVLCACMHVFVDVLVSVISFLCACMHVFVDVSVSVIIVECSEFNCARVLPTRGVARLNI
jgi:hypothetical protein